MMNTLIMNIVITVTMYVASQVIATLILRRLNATYATHHCL